METEGQGEQAVENSRKDGESILNKILVMRGEEPYTTIKDWSEENDKGVWVEVGS